LKPGRHRGAEAGHGGAGEKRRAHAVGGGDGRRDAVSYACRAAEVENE